MFLCGFYLCAFRTAAHLYTLKEVGDPFPTTAQRVFNRFEGLGLVLFLPGNPLSGRRPLKWLEEDAKDKERLLLLTQPLKGFSTALRVLGWVLLPGNPLSGRRPLKRLVEVAFGAFPTTAQRVFNRFEGLGWVLFLPGNPLSGRRPLKRLVEVAFGAFTTTAQRVFNRFEGLGWVLLPGNPLSGRRPLKRLVEVAFGAFTTTAQRPFNRFEGLGWVLFLPGNPLSGRRPLKWLEEDAKDKERLLLLIQPLKGFSTALRVLVLVLFLTL